MTPAGTITLPATLGSLSDLREDTGGWTPAPAGSAPVLAMTAQSVTLGVASSFGIGAGEQPRLR